MKKLKLDSFVLLLFVAVALSYFFPQLAYSSYINLNTVISVGITLIFFFYGLKLSFEDIKRDLRNWKLHIVIQLSTFLLFPLLVVAFKPFVFSADKESIWLAFMFLAALPSTVSSSVVMVSLARGNVPASIFNATISGLIGIIITPLWMGLFIEQSAADFHLGPIYIKLVTEILLPVGLGLLLQHYFSYFHRFTLKYAILFNGFDKTVILLIVYNSFAKSFVDRIFSSVDAWGFLIVVLGSVAIFFVVYEITGFISKRLKFNLPDTIAVQFNGTKKSLLHGTVFSKVLFGAGSVPIGIILLPIMIYHTLQIFIVSIIATKKGARDD